MRDKPLVVQSDRTLLLELSHPQAEEARKLVSSFADLIKSPDYIHTYGLSSLSLWNACALGWTAERVYESLAQFSRYSIPEGIKQFIQDEMSKYGRIKLTRGKRGRILLSGEASLLEGITLLPDWEKFQIRKVSGGYELSSNMRGELKRYLTRNGYPILDEVGYQASAFLEMENGEPTPINLLKENVKLRSYQEEAVESILNQRDMHDGSGVILLPCGAGKTLVGLALLAALKVHTLFVTPNLISLRQWMNEARLRLRVPEEWLGEYSSAKKQIKPLTFTTYQMLSYQSKGRFLHFDALNERSWGLILYDEVQLLPAPMFRLCAAVQGIRRIGLTATLVREDGAETDVFSLIGPKRYEAPWRAVEKEGFLANVRTIELSVSMALEDRVRYLQAPARAKYRLAAENKRKIDLVKQLVAFHRDAKLLVIGNYIEQLERISQELDVPLLCGKTPNAEREKIYKQFRDGDLNCIVVSRVANVAVDLPDARVAIQVSGQYGSRQEEAQRLGRILRPNADGVSSLFYTLVTADTIEQEKAVHRQLFLAEQGYSYELIAEHDWLQKVMKCV